jgi:poly(3-hydroxybutyrate) depolymerase
MRAASGFDALAVAEGFLVGCPEDIEFSPGRHVWNTGNLLRR